VLVVVLECISKHSRQNFRFFFDQTGRFFGQRRSLYETPPGRYSEKIERRTSNVQHRTSNIDDATLYLFKNNRTAKYWTAACDEPFGRELRVERLGRIEFRRVDSLAQRGRLRRVLLSLFLD